jgi:hypothetical protein
MLNRGDIEATLRRLNDAENGRRASTVEATIASIDAVHAADFEAWSNGRHTPNREAERETERTLFELLADYQRRFDRVLIDPPYASVAWTIEGTARGSRIELPGCSNIEFDDAARIRRAWIYFDPTPVARHWPA